MTDFPAVLRELIVTGYEGDSLLSAFARMYAAVGGGMTDFPAVLRELMVAGYGGESLLAAFERMCAAIGGSMQIVHGAPAKASKSEVAANDAAGVTDAQAPAAFDVVAPPDGAKAIARKAFMRAGLKASAMKVGSQLVEHFNIETGRCDPGHEGLAASIGCDERTVRRAISELVGRGLLRSQRHGGRFRSNSYQMNWKLLVELAGAGDIASSRTIESAMPDNAAHQNHLRKPDSDSLPVKAPRGRKPDHGNGQLGMLLPMAGGLDQAREAVRQKLNHQLNKHLQAFDKSVFVEGLTRSMGIDWAPAITAEMRRHGDGLAVLLSAIESVGLRKAAGC